MKFDIINPSDPYTMEAPDLQIAAVAVCLLGDGRYAATAIGDDAGKGENVPLFLFGGHDQWFVERWGMDYGATAEHCIERRNEELAKAFDSVKLGRDKRSSLNDIGGRAAYLAKAVRMAVGAGKPAAG